MKLYEVYGADTIQAIKEENPYQLVEAMPAVFGSKKADKIAEKNGDRP